MFRTKTLPQVEGVCALRTRASALKGAQRCVEVGSRAGRAGTLGGDRSTRIECASPEVPPGSVVEGRCHCGREGRRFDAIGVPSRGPRLPVKVLARRTEMKETPRRGYCTQAVVGTLPCSRHHRLDSGRGEGRLARARALRRGRCVPCVRSNLTVLPPIPGVVRPMLTLRCPGASPSARLRVDKCRRQNHRPEPERERCEYAPAKGVSRETRRRARSGSLACLCQANRAARYWDPRGSCGLEARRAPRSRLSIAR